MMVMVMIGEQYPLLCSSYFKTAVKLAITLISGEGNEPSNVLCWLDSVFCLKLPAFLASHWRPAGSLQIWYRLNREKEPDIFTPTSINLANGELHRIQIHREGRDMYVQVSFAYISRLNYFWSVPLAVTNLFNEYLHSYVSTTVLYYLFMKHE